MFQSGRPPDEHGAIMQATVSSDRRLNLNRISENIWVYDDTPISAGGLPLPIRMTIVRLSDGDLLLHSPVRYSPSLREKLQSLGRIRYLLAPNIAHWMFLADWQAALPDA